MASFGTGRTGSVVVALALGCAASIAGNGGPLKGSLARLAMKLYVSSQQILAEEGRSTFGTNVFVAAGVIVDMPI